MPGNPNHGGNLMKNLRKIVLTLMLLVALPLAAQAMQHESGAAGMDNGKMKMDDSKMDMDHGKMKMDDSKMDMDHGKMDMDHGGMKMSGDMIMLGNAVQDGVKGMAHLKDVKQAMAKMGMKTTHHFMVMFADVESGKPIDSGVAAVKVKGADGKETEAVKLMGMQGHFGADIELGAPGKYEFEVGTKLADGKKRQFEFEVELK
jgi:hypothetical protein